MLKPGLYEQVINKAMSNELESFPENRKEIKTLDEAEASKILSEYLSSVIQKGLNNVIDKGGDISNQVSLANKIVKIIEETTQDLDFATLSIERKAEQLLALLGETDPVLATHKTISDICRPETSIAQSSLFTGSLHEPPMYTELKKEILTANKIDMLVSFIKWSGLRLIINELQEFTHKGGELRIITTSYMGATDVKAIEELRKLPNTFIKVSYDTKRTRLHAKTYVFYRDTGFSTAYIGSSNLSNAAISSGLEWNIKIAKQDQPETIDKINATFESYWNSNEFEYYSETQKERLARALNAEKYFNHNNAETYTIDVKPYSYQQEILDELEAERTIRNSSKNLIVAATGTGKTVISALDYKRFRKQNPGALCRLLFVAHREEILEQSLATFRAVLKNGNFGEMFNGKTKPDGIDHLFISIQTFNSQNFTSKTTPDFYNYIVVDEFHHAAAPTYQKLLVYYRPQILLGLTATPERMDGKNILQYFDNRIAAEIRLPEAIERKLLCPFQYFGITDDTVDLNEVRWTHGGYDKNELSLLYTASKQRADWIVSSLLKYITDIDEVKGLGFCVSTAHAAFMSDYFNTQGIPSICLTGQSPDDERRKAKDWLVSGKIRFIFVVDIYNEGVDIPDVNTVLFLRPTESLTVFLQQLGRGLRLADGKECLTVLDFIGQANKRYNFEDKFAALLFNTTHSVSREIKEGFVSLPKGCYIQLEKIAARHILDNIRSSYGNTAGLISRISTFEEDSGEPLTLHNFLDHYRIDPRSIYRFSNFSRLCVNADIKECFNEPMELLMTKAFAKFATIDSRRWITFLLDVLQNLRALSFQTLPEVQKRMLRMFVITLWGKDSENWDDYMTEDHLHGLCSNPVMVNELSDLLRYQFDHIDFIDSPVNIGFDCPLDAHCTYTRDQILSALDFQKPSTVREGVKWLEDKKLDVFFITLNKADKDYSPTTMYNDYSINERLFHWQSQSTTSENSKTGQRYIHHKEMGSKVLLFVREFKNDSLSNNAEAYTFLGTANYVRHSGSKPMNIVWRLDKPIPAKFLKKTNKLVIA